MKKITSAAFLAIQLTWKLVLVLFLATAGLQIFNGFQELMPGGVPLQVTFGFEHLLRSAVQPIGRWSAVLLMAVLIASSARSKGSKSTYTMNRLGLSEIQMTLVFGGVFTGYLILFWAIQLLTAYGIFVWYSRYALVGSNAWMLACWRSEWLHTLLPLAEWWGWLRNFAICLSFGFSSAFASQQGRRGKVPLTWFIAPLLCIFLLTGKIGDLGPDLLLTVLLTAFTVGYFFVLKGGREDEDL